MSRISLFFSQHFDHASYLFLIIPLFILLFYLYHHSFYKDKESAETLQKKKKLKLFVLISRCFLILLLLLALAGPFTEQQHTIKGTPKVRILIDNSTSMKLFNQSLASSLAKALEKQMPVDVSTFADGDHSPLGEGIMSGLRRDENLLLFTDGYQTEGLSLGDVALYAATLNSSISALTLRPAQYDASLTILGPEKTTSDADNLFVIKLQQTDLKQVPVTITVDGKTVFDKATDATEIPIHQSFHTGTHTLTAKVGLQDFFPQNNVFYKTVKVVPKPKVFLWTQQASPLTKLFSPVYDLDEGTELPKELSPYTAVIVNNLDAETVKPQVDRFVNYISSGNGFVVVGGGQSYESGGYKGSRFEQLLPVTISQAGKKKGDVSIVLVIDISGSTGVSFGDNTKLDVQKALALGILKDISLVNRVGVVAFNTEAYTITNVSLLVQQIGLEDKITRLVFNGGTLIDTGLGQAVNLLEDAKGSKNIILISDGLTRDVEKAVRVAQFASSQGIRIYTVGVGDDTNVDVMQQLADIGGGAFFQPDTKEKIKLLFGASEISGSRRVIPFFVFDDHHFITEGVSLKGSLFGFNTFFPKAGAKVLVTTDTGDPLFVAGRFGLGRVVSVGTDDGSLFGPELLNKQNSRIWTRSVNWAIGDPERKNERYLDIHDTRIGQLTDVLFKSPDEPRSEELAFVKIDKELYKASFTPSDIGFQQLFDATYGVNSLQEYAAVGMNPALGKFARSTGGKMFSPDQIDEIVSFMKTKSKRSILEKRSYAWIFALLAILLFLAEIAARRVVKNFYKS
ncbi:VWA domain-containing protein [Candidatus Woesearchaeota archaeon]|nr:VWA domain-containing protein [Candidatus Woesearchaeota archaeon]